MYYMLKGLLIENNSVQFEFYLQILFLLFCNVLFNKIIFLVENGLIIKFYLLFSWIDYWDLIFFVLFEKKKK